MAFPRINWRITIARFLLIAGFAMIGYFYGTGLYANYAQEQLHREWKAVVRERASLSAISGRPAKSPAPDLSRGGIFGRLVISRLGVDAIVLEGTSQAILTRGPGHIRGTAGPHEGRNTAISAHRTTFGAPFARLDEVRRGDLIELTTLQGVYRFRVSGKDIVRPTDVSVIGQRFKNRLTLTTCDPPGSAVKRLAVWAVLDSPAENPE